MRLIFLRFLVVVLAFLSTKGALMLEPRAIALGTHRTGFSSPEGARLRIVVHRQMLASYPDAVVLLADDRA
jgi:hypothetical protein